MAAGKIQGLTTALSTKLHTVPSTDIHFLGRSWTSPRPHSNWGGEVHAADLVLDFRARIGARLWTVDETRRRRQHVTALPSNVNFVLANFKKLGGELVCYFEKKLNKFTGLRVCTCTLRLVVFQKKRATCTISSGGNVWEILRNKWDNLNSARIVRLLPADS